MVWVLVCKLRNIISKFSLVILVAVLIKLANISLKLAKLRNNKLLTKYFFYDGRVVGDNEEKLIFG